MIKRTEEARMQPIQTAADCVHGQNEERAYRLGFLRAKNPDGWDEQDDITHGDAVFDGQMAADITSDYPRAWNWKADGCEFCLGAKGGTPGNENVLHGHKICDHCSTLIKTPSAEDGFTVEQWRSAGERLSEAMEHGECTEGELIGLVLDALGIPSIKPELILRDMLEKQS